MSAIVFLPQAFIDLYKDVLSIAESLLRSPEIAVSNYGSKMYEQVFINLDTYCQQVRFLTISSTQGPFGPMNF